MKSLLPGIKLFSKELDIADRIFLSAGAQIAKEEGYHEGSYVPINDLRKPTPSELSMLVSEQTVFGFDEYSSSIGIVRLPEKIASICEQIGFSKIGNRRDIKDKFEVNNLLFNDLNREINIFVNRFSANESTVLPFAQAAPITTNGLLTLTRRYLPGVEHYLMCGMHADCDAGVTVLAGKTARNRLVLNLTDEARVFVYTNISTNDLVGHYKTEFSITSKELDDRNLLVKEFYNKNCDYPIIFLSLNPYEAYIAPTDNFIHDGSTIFRKKQDFVMSFLGNFILN